MNNQMQIFIPTMHRTENQLTIKTIPNNWKSRTHFVTVEEDVEGLKKYGIDIMVPPKTCKGIGPTRQWVLENCPVRFALMIDDDQHFYKRLENDWHLKYLHDKEFFEQDVEMNRMLDLIESLLSQETTSFGKKYFSVAVSSRQGNNNSFPEKFVECTRMNNTYAIDTQLYKQEGVRFDNFRVIEDFDTTLSMLTRGYPNIVLQEYCWGQLTSNMAGGCSEYRTREILSEDVHALKKKFPNFVSVVVKTSKSGWEGMEERDDVRIQWKKAFESSRIKPKRTLF